MNERENNHPLFIGFSSQKGGVGKSTLAEVISSILYYEKGINLFVIDCDVTQDSFFKLREREKRTIEESEEMSRYMQSYFSGLGRIAYRIHKASPSDSIVTAKDYLQEKKDETFRAVIFDFPGHAGTRELLELSLEMDYIISPIEADTQSMVSCLSYAKSIQDLGVEMEGARIKDIMLLWNKVDRRVRSTLMDHYSEYIREQGLTLLPNHIYLAHRFTHELAAYGIKGVFRSSYLPPLRSLRDGTGLDEMIEDLLVRINLKAAGNNAND